VVLAPWVVVDVETTGMDAFRDAVIQVAAARSEEDGSLSVANWFVDPGRPIPAAIGRLTGFVDVDFSQYPRLHQIHADIKSFLADRWVVGHNITFDQEFLERAGISWSQGVDTLEWARIAFPGERSYRLSDLMAERGFRFHGIGFKKSLSPGQTPHSTMPDTPLPGIDRSGIRLFPESGEWIRSVCDDPRW